MFGLLRLGVLNLADVIEDKHLLMQRLKCFLVNRLLKGKDRRVCLVKYRKIPPLLYYATAKLFLNRCQCRGQSAGLLMRCILYN